MAPLAPKHPQPSPVIDWEEYVLCQEDAGEPWQCPVRSTDSVVGNGYKSLVSHFIQFRSMGTMPIEHRKSYIMKDVALKLQC